MNTGRVRVWVEEIEPPAKLLFTWRVPDDDESDIDTTRDSIADALSETDGVLETSPQDDGVLVEIDPERTTRYELARVIRLVIDPSTVDEDTRRIRVWAEDLSNSELRITWFDREPEDELGARPERRKIAAWLSVQPGVRTARPDSEGVFVRYEPERLDRSKIGDVVRAAIRDTTPLRDRADKLLKRGATYGNLARKLALDDRISPIPDAAKQAAGARMAGGGGNAAMRTAMRFIPGAALITRIHTLLPMLTELSKWSREADPEIVDQHLGSVGLDRETLRADTITAHEIRLYARDSATERTAELGERAQEGARQAITKGREFLTSMRESMQTDEQTDQTNVESPDPEAKEDSNSDAGTSNS